MRQLRAPLVDSAAAGPPRFLANPHVPTLGSRTPVGPPYQAIQCGDAAPELQHAKGSHDDQRFRGSMTGLGTHDLRFAGWVAPPPRKTGFPLRATLYGVGLATHRVGTKSFGDKSSVASSFPRLCLAQIALVS